MFSTEVVVDVFFAMTVCNFT